MFDGVGAFNFLASWAHISSGKDERDLLLPNHSREALLNAPGASSPNLYESGSSSSASSIYEQAHIAAIQDLYGIPMQAVASDDKCWESALARFGQINCQAGLQFLTLCMKKETVETWKRLAVQKGLLSKCSTFEVLCAHVWKVYMLVAIITIHQIIILERKKMIENIKRKTQFKFVEVNLFEYCYCL